MTEAIAILNWHPLIRNIAFGRRPEDHEGRILWRWNGSDQGNGVLGFVQQGEDSIVAWVFIAFPEPFSLTEIRTAYGDPSHVAPVFFDGDTAHVGRTRFFDLSLIYLPQGFFVQTETTFGPAPKISPNMPLANSVIFFSPTATDLDEIPVSIRGWNNVSLVPWQGFRDFGFYCQQVPPANDPPDDGVQSCPNVISTLPERSVVPSAIPPQPTAVPGP